MAAETLHETPAMDVGRAAVGNGERTFVTTRLTAQQQLNDFSPAVLDDRHERQHSLLEATGQLGPPPYDVLDLGSGSGVSAVWSARKGWRVTAVDASAENLAVLRQQMIAEPQLAIRPVVSDAVVCDDVPDDSFDIVYLKDLIEHVPDYHALLSTTSRKLRRGGLAYLATTNVVCPLQLEYHGVGPYSWYPRWLKDYIREYAMTRRPAIVRNTPYPALHWFSRRSLRNALRLAGFSRSWDMYDLIRSPADLTRRTRLVYPFVRGAQRLPWARDIVDLLIVGLTVVAQK
jgi:2-polyprenyl-6-hydroxyphenyl methylase/3-demethylubiquinone-9 3-methyltransferase